MIPGKQGSSASTEAPGGTDGSPSAAGRGSEASRCSMLQKQRGKEKGIAGSEFEKFFERGSPRRGNDAMGPHGDLSDQFRIHHL